MKYYLLFFSGIYIVATILCGILGLFINIGSASTVPTLLAAGFLTSWQFVRREQRIPDAQEKKQLIWGSIACTFIISAILVSMAFLFIAPLRDMLMTMSNLPMWIWAFMVGVLAILILIEFAIFHISYCWYVNQCLKGFEKKKHLK